VSNEALSHGSSVGRSSRKVVGGGDPTVSEVTQCRSKVTWTQSQTKKPSKESEQQEQLHACPH